VIKFISSAYAKQGQPYFVRCTCDAHLLVMPTEDDVTCGHCFSTVTPQIVGDAESVSVQDSGSGEWKSYPVQGFQGMRSPWTPKAGDIVGKGGGTERWRIESIKGGVAALKLLGNKKDTGLPVELNFREEVPLSMLYYTPD
jgi:hypothetical protein